MPIKMFKPCEIHEGDVYLTSEAKCPSCGRANEFEGWYKNRREAMATYQYVCGLKPIGPHRPLADELLGSKRRRCDDCNGGIITESETCWRLCTACEGTGGFWTCSAAEIEAARRAVLKEFPESRVEQTPTDLVSPGIAYRLRDGTIADLLDNNEDAIDENGDEGNVDELA